MEEMNKETKPRGDESGCVNCQHPDIEAGYQAPLCRECRKKLSRYPVAKWVKAFAIVISILFLISLYQLPRYFKAGVTFKKALHAESAHRYVTEKKLLQKVLQQFPNHYQAGMHYMMACFKNDDLHETDSMINLLWEKETENEQVIAGKEKISEGMALFSLRDDHFADSLSQFDNETPQYRDALDQYYQKRSVDACAAILLGTYTYHQGDYVKAERIVHKLVQDEPAFLSAWVLLSNIYQDDKQYDKAREACDEALRINAEYAPAWAAYATMLLKQKQDKEALEKAASAYEMDPENSSALYALALANHFNNHPEERDRLYEKLKSILGENARQVAELEYFISGKYNYR